ncbi:hypothetical protein LTR37_011942 [Vermiconidia calcicola]|uniref:Uncharacterized protein n=1 Tax=Vermiconidia calcicola TaxID=1690605 RepID=A0ACC3N0S4_9PEZI|nr:hypothetical protein LTR37_011942 [Vermiconidia calcicola]
MAPKKAVAKAGPDEGKTQQSAGQNIEGTTSNGEKLVKKRKQASDAGDPQKAPRRSGRGESKAQPSQEQLLQYMLSQDAEELCRPDEESEDIRSRGNIKTYSSDVMNPFEELLSAVILSRPISHRLGLRTIRTIFNEPYNFTSAKAVQQAGQEKHHQAVWDARTQHKAKTAEEIGQIANVVLEKFTTSSDKDGMQLQKLLDDSGNDVDKALDTLKASIKGLGETGIKIFLRRVQWLWTSGYPYIDDRTMQSLGKLSLPEDAEELEGLIAKHWSKYDEKRLAGDNEAAKKRRAFVTVLERAIGADLEGKVDNLLAAAGEQPVAKLPLAF